MNGIGFFSLSLLCLLACFNGGSAQNRERRADPICERRPVDETNSERRPGTNGFRLTVASKNPVNGSSSSTTVGYGPGEQYTVTLEGWRTEYTVQTFRGFSLVAVSKTDSNKPVGTFQVRDGSNVRTSSHCWYALTHNSLHPKTNLEITWQAPTVNQGCVQFKAMVLEYRDIWYMDDDALTQELCPSAAFETQAPASDAVEECCACDEATYELVVQGIWSRQSHPKDFPTLVHLTHFSDFIGASHSPMYTMWGQGGYATEGLKDLAEWGDTRKYEEEIKDEGKEVRTVVKSRGLWFPNVQGTAKSVFRSDKYHHLVSLASMLGPSPDWFVGVSSVNLCLRNCSWVQELNFDLTPWDAGTDGGITYMAPNNPSIPREPIKQITTKDPDDRRAPFYSPSSDGIPPLAKLTIRRTKIVTSPCKNASEYATQNLDQDAETSEDLEYKDRRECMVGSWTPFSVCSATCGKGLRMRSRVYRNPAKAQVGDCRRQLTEKQFCNAEISVCEGSENFNDICDTTDWSSWTDCTVTCGKGVRSRTRNFNNPMGMKKCSVELMQKEMCTGIGGEECGVEQDPRCQTTFWSEWSPCSHSCGEGIRVRTRLLYYPENQDECTNAQLMEKETCNLQRCDVFLIRHGQEICAEALEPGLCQGVFPRYYFDSESRTCRRFVYTGCKGTRNNFESEEQCRTVCLKTNTGDTEDVADDGSDGANPLHSGVGSNADGANDGGLAFDCMMTEWSPWSECSNSCGRGKRQRNRMVKVPARNGGQPCPRQLMEKSKCRLRPCPVDCRMGPWSEWSVCSASCGGGVHVRQRYGRSIYRRINGQPCPPSQTEKRNCNTRAC